MCCKKGSSLKDLDNKKEGEREAQREIKIYKYIYIYIYRERDTDTQRERGEREREREDKKITQKLFLINVMLNLMELNEKQNQTMLK